MATGKKNTINRKTKRVIRKTIAGLCMASAIAVALIPPQSSEAYIAPDALNYNYGIEATDITPSANKTDRLYSDKVKLDLYSKTDVEGNAMNKAEYIAAGGTETMIDDTTSDTIYSGKDVYDILTVGSLTDGTYTLNWQFKMYLQDVGGTAMGVICSYNSTYAQSVVSINPSMPYEYVIISEDEYTDFYDAYKAAFDATAATATVVDKNGTNHSLKAKYTTTYDDYIENPTSNYDQYWLSKYFPDDFAIYKNSFAKYDTYVTEKAAYDVYLAKKQLFDDYVAAYQAWKLSGEDPATEPAKVEDPGSMVEPVPVSKPSLTKYVHEMTPDSKLSYFCDVCPDYNNSTISLAGYKLCEVADYRGGSTGATINNVYMPKGVPNPKFSEDADLSDGVNKNDGLGFRIAKKCLVIAIGENAFRGTTNVDILDICGEIKYIGDNAFRDSFVQSVSFENVKNIGNRAFYGCSRLVGITLTDGTVNIGTEAFYGCKFTEIVFPKLIEYIGPGAFANCTKLKTIDFSLMDRDDVVLDSFAFYDAIALDEIKFSNAITEIHDCCFACMKGVSGSLTSFKFPDNICTQQGIGNFVLAGRTNLQSIVMPADYGKSVQVTLPYGVFYNCSSLRLVEFPAAPGACGMVVFGKYDDGTEVGRTMFDTVQTEDFYVRGPAKDINNRIASPRKSTWGLKTNLGNDVPYVYIDENGNEQFEISDGKYILIIDENGILQSCILADNSPSALAQGIELTIPSKVGDTKVKGVSSECFSDSDIHDNLTKLIIANNSITEIAEAAFKGCPRLEYVSIGNTITNIGASAFENCPKLTYVNFETPIGGYSALPLENIGEKAFSTGSQSLTFEGDIDSNYGPFVWAMQLDNYVSESKGVRVCYKTGFPTFLTVIVDNRNGLPTLLDYPHYEQINELSGTAGDTFPLTERYNHLGEETMVPNANGELEPYIYNISLDEERLVNGALNPVIPLGIKSIDAQGFINNTSKEDVNLTGVRTNTNNVYIYLSGIDYYNTYKQYGLFNGYYGDTYDIYGNACEYEQGSNMEEEPIGNDRITSVTLNSIKYLPDNCFHSCENLSNVYVNTDIEDIGDAPFAGCTKLTSVGGMGDKYTCYNGIIYRINDDSTYSIAEVLSSRGRLVGATRIKINDEDPYLANVSSIDPGAFQDCDSITNVDLTGFDTLTQLPDNCFKGCGKLNQVIIPENITILGHNCFADTMEGIEVVFHGYEVFIPGDAFEGLSSKRVVSYRDSAARKSARDLGADVSDILDETVKVNFLDYDATALSDTLYVVIGDSIKLEDIPADPVREGYTFKGWNHELVNITEDLMIFATYEQNPGDPANGGNNDNYVKVQFYDYDGSELSKVIYVYKGESVKLEDIPENPTREGYKFAGWNKSLIKLTQDTIVIATYEKATPDPGVDPNVTPTPTPTPTPVIPPTTVPTQEPAKFYTLTVTNGNGSGSYAAGAVVIITCTNPPSGKTFDKWVPTTDDLGIASVNVAATTLVMPAHEASITATFKNLPTNTGDGTATRTPTPVPTSAPGNTIVISKSGISNTSLASATVTGSSDNYVIRINENAATTAAVEKALTNEYGDISTIRYTAMDITLYDSTGTTKITDFSGLSVTLTIPLPDVMAQYAGNNKVASVVNEKLERITPRFTTIDGVKCVTFTASHFSPYTIYVDTHNLETTVIDVTPKTGDKINPKWFLSGGLAILGFALFFMKDRRSTFVAA